VACIDGFLDATPATRYARIGGVTEDGFSTKLGSVL
jgi:hypothetical protein